MSRARERATAWVAILGNSQKSLKNGTWAITTHRRRERVSWTPAWRVACSRATSWWDQKEIRWTKNVLFSRSLLPEHLLFFLPKERETKIQQVCQNTPNGRNHAPDFSFKNAKLRLNIIIIITSSFVNVFIAFNHLYSSVIRTCRGKNGGFVPNAKPQIAKAKKPNPKLSKCEWKHRCRVHHREAFRRP